MGLILSLTSTVIIGTENTKEDIAIFAGGCFWCVESDFDKVEGVSKTVSGYIGGTTPNPTYKQVSRGKTDHTEAVEITFDPSVVDYDTLLTLFWRSIDPTTVEGQFCDIGNHYRPEIFTLSEKQHALALASKKALEKNKPFDQPIVVNITKSTTFYPAEEYHQDFYTKNPVHYERYRSGCGRDTTLDKLWGEK